MSPDLVVMGPCGTATRAAGLDRVNLGGVAVDEWHLSPGKGPAGRGRLATVDEGPIFVSVVDPQVGYELGPLDLVLIVSRIDPQLQQTARHHRLPAALAATVTVMAPMHVDDYDHARVVMRHLMRSAVDGTIPTVPASGGDATVWALAVAAICRVTARPADTATAAVVAGTG